MQAIFVALQWKRLAYKKEKADLRPKKFYKIDSKLKRLTRDKLSSLFVHFEEKGFIALIIGGNFIKLLNTSYDFFRYATVIRLSFS